MSLSGLIDVCRSCPIMGIRTFPNNVEIYRFASIVVPAPAWLTILRSSGCNHGFGIYRSEAWIYLDPGGVRLDRRYLLGRDLPRRPKASIWAMSWHAIQKGLEDGCELATLQSFAMGRPVYKRMGFRIATDFRRYQVNAARSYLLQTGE